MRCDREGLELMIVGLQPNAPTDTSTAGMLTPDLREWRTRLPGGRRVLYIEATVVSKGEKGYIAMGVVERGSAAWLARQGSQPGWRSGTPVCQTD